MTELALAALDPSEIDRAADPAAFVVLCCERAKSWLAHAVDQGDIDSIVETKSQAEAIRVYTVQKQLGKDSEIAAAEIVRRAERGIGVAIRRGQAEGRIRKIGDDTRTDLSDRVVDNNLVSPREAAQVLYNSDVASFYSLADGVSDEQFDAAIDEAKAEGNLSRANVKRKVKGEAPSSPRPEVLRGTRHHDSNRIVEQTVISLEGLCIGVDLIDYTQLDPAKRDAWLASLRTSLRTINRLAKELGQA